MHTIIEMFGEGSQSANVTIVPHAATVTRGYSTAVIEAFSTSVGKITIPVTSTPQGVARFVKAKLSSLYENPDIIDIIVYINLEETMDVNINKIEDGITANITKTNSITKNITKQSGFTATIERSNSLTATRG